MASAKLKRVKSHMTGKTVKVECPECYEEFGSHACIRPAHDVFTRKFTEDEVKAATKLVKVVQNEEKPVEKEVLAIVIVSISDSVTKLYSSGLNRRAVVALIADDTKLGKGTIDAVLNSLLDLRKTYTK